MAPLLHSSLCSSMDCLQMSCCCCYWNLSRRTWGGVASERPATPPPDQWGINGPVVNCTATRGRQRLDKRHRVAPPPMISAEPPMTDVKCVNTPVGPSTTDWSSRCETSRASSTHCWSCSSVKQVEVTLEIACFGVRGRQICLNLF